MASKREPIAPANQMLPGRRVLITGAARRNGRKIALGFARAGADVIITYRQSRAEAERTVADLRGLGVGARALRCDVRDEPSIKAAVKQAAKHLGGIDFLINN